MSNKNVYKKSLLTTVSKKQVYICEQILNHLNKMTDLSYLKNVNRRVLSFATLEESDTDDLPYWLTKLPIERLMALEVLRQQSYKNGSTSPRFQRFLEIIEPS